MACRAMWSARSAAPPAEQREVQLLVGLRPELPVGRGGNAGAGRQHRHAAPVACSGNPNGRAPAAGRARAGGATDVPEPQPGRLTVRITSVTPDLDSVGPLRQAGRHTYLRNSLGGYPEAWR